MTDDLHPDVAAAAAAAAEPKKETTVAEWVRENAGDMYGDCLVGDPDLTPEGLLDALADLVSESLPRLAAKFKGLEADHARLKAEHAAVLLRLRAAENVCKAAEEEITDLAEGSHALNGWANLPLADWKLARMMHQRGRSGG